MAKKEECAICTKAKNVGSWKSVRCSYFGRQPNFDDTPCQHHSTDDENTSQCPDCGAKYNSSWDTCPFCASVPKKDNTLDINDEINKEELPPQCPSCGSRNVVFKSNINKKKFFWVLLISFIVGLFIIFYFSDIFDSTASIRVGGYGLLIISIILAILAGRTVVCKCRKCRKEFDNSISANIATPKTNINDAPCCPNCGSRLIFERSKKSPKYWLIAFITFIAIFAIIFIIILTNYRVFSNPLTRFILIVACIPIIKVPDWFLLEKGTIISYKCSKCKHVFGTKKSK